MSASMAGVRPRGREQRGGLHGEGMRTLRWRTGAAVLDAQELARLRPGIGEKGRTWFGHGMHVPDTVQNASGMALPLVLTMFQIAPYCAIGCLRILSTHTNKNHSKIQKLVM